MTTDPPSFARNFPNLASPRYGTRVIEASDEFFAAKERLIKDTTPVFIPDRFDDHGKWMDGWESRRRRDDSHDWCLIKLGAPGRIYGVDIDTAHFTGNFPPSAGIEACVNDGDGRPDGGWSEIVLPSALGGDQHHFLAVDKPGPWDWLRLNIFPDGGVARLRVFGRAAPDWSTVAPDAVIELSSLKNGGRVIAYNNAHYGDVWAVLAEGRGANMGDGWETRRRREPGHDWLIIALGARGLIEEVEIDTAHFKGNFPDSASLEAADIDPGASDDIIAQSPLWKELMPPRKLKADSIHRFGATDLTAAGPVSCVKLNIHPDGGVSRFRIFAKRV